MSDPVMAAVIGLGGVVSVAIVTIITQLHISKSNARLEREKISLQLRGQEASKQREKRQDRLIDALSELLVAADPQSAIGVDYGKTINHIVRIQLLLDLNITSEKKLNGALNELGLRLPEYLSVQSNPIDGKLAQTKALLRSHSKVVDAAKDMLKDNSSLAITT